MNDEVDRIRNEIKRYGFLSATQIRVRFARKKIDIDKIIRSLECEEIKRIEYTNSFVGPQKVKDLFYYNPNKPKQRKRNANRKRKYTKSQNTKNV